MYICIFCLLDLPDGAEENGNASGPAAPGPVPGEHPELLDPANDIQLTRRNSFEVCNV